MKYSLKTTVFPDMKFLQELDYIHDNGVVENIHRLLYDAREEQTKQALVALGWTPPEHT